MRVDALLDFAADYCMGISGVDTAQVAAFYLAVRIMRVTGSYISLALLGVMGKEVERRYHTLGNY
jgi:hypothetical protein